MKEIQRRLTAAKAEIFAKYKAEIREGTKELNTLEDLENLTRKAEEELKEAVKIWEEGKEEKKRRRNWMLFCCRMCDKETDDVIDCLKFLHIFFRYLNMELI